MLFTNRLSYELDKSNATKQVKIIVEGEERVVTVNVDLSYQLMESYFNAVAPNRLFKAHY